ncbi:MAG: hypothetical protein ACRELY_17800, partial [Polyangiaceae bacterium]
MNAAAVNSDGSVVGLQAMHMLRGEWTPMLEGSSYQTSTDAMVAAFYFAIFGATPLVLMLSALVGHLLVLWIVYSMLSRFVERGDATILCSLLVFTTCSIDVYALHPPRE